MRAVAESTKMTAHHFCPPALELVNQDTGANQGRLTRFLHQSICSASNERHRVHVAVHTLLDVEKSLVLLVDLRSYVMAKTGESADRFREFSQAPFLKLELVVHL